MDLVMGERSSGRELVDEIRVIVLVVCACVCFPFAADLYDKHTMLDLQSRSLSLCLSVSLCLYLSFSVSL